MLIRPLAFFATATALLAACALPARATSYPAIFVYGDSLSDNGNLYKLTGGLAPASPPYYNGRFSNGPVAVEQLAGLLHAPLFDFAVGGATSGVGNIGDGGSQTSLGVFRLPGMLAELQGASVPANLVPSSLFIVWGGANDFEMNGDVNTAVSDIDSIVQTLELEGATNILVPGLPDIGLTPEYYGDAAATTYSTTFNAELQATLPGNALYADTFHLLNAIEANPGNYGLMNTTQACYNQLTGSVCANPNQYLFFDGLHPSSNVDAYVAQSFAADLNPVAATPEPSSLLLLGTGLAGFTAMLRRRKTA